MENFNVNNAFDHDENQRLWNIYDLIVSETTILMVDQPILFVY